MRCRRSTCWDALLDHRARTINVLASPSLSARRPHTPCRLSIPDSCCLLAPRSASCLSLPVLQSTSRTAVRCVGRSALLQPSCFATVAAEVALAPVAALLFSRVTFAGLFLNFAAIPLMTDRADRVDGHAGPVNVQRAAWHLPRGYAVHLAATGLVESARLTMLRRGCPSRSSRHQAGWSWPTTFRSP